MHGYLSTDITCSEEGTVFRELSLRKSVSFEKHIMSKDKYVCIFLKPNGGYCVSYLTIIPQVRVGYEMVDSQRAA